MASITFPGRLAPLQSPVDRIRAADPLLMSAAIAYNFFFALVPLAIAVVAWLSTIGRSEEGIATLEEFLREALPADVADFVIQLVQEAEGIVGDSQGPVIVISLLIALYAGSRGIYAVQKAIRQIERAHEERPWWKVRGLGILFTLGAGIALIGGYIVLLFGGLLMELLDRIGLDVGSVGGLSITVLALWLAVVLYSIYRWGPPVPIQRPLVAAVAATLILVLMTWLAAYFVPTFGGRSNTLSTLGAVGIVLIWLYAIGFVVITVPALAKPTEAVIRGTAE